MLGWPLLLEVGHEVCSSRYRPAGRRTGIRPDARGACEERPATRRLLSLTFPTHDLLARPEVAGSITMIDGQRLVPKCPLLSEMTDDDKALRRADAERGRQAGAEISRQARTRRVFAVPRREWEPGALLRAGAGPAAGRGRSNPPPQLHLNLGPDFAR